MAKGNKVLVIGGGGREHALALRALMSPSVSEVVVSPGNAGTTALPNTVTDKPIRSLAGDPLEIASADRPDLVVVGPEAPLCDGVVDRLSAAGFLAYGPSRAAAQLEASKAFMKDFAARHGIRTARYEVVRDVAAAERAIGGFSSTPVVKADGLCAGKGVVVADTNEEALASARDMLSGERFGDAGKTVVLEERLVGAEASVHAICDGERAFVLPAAQDHKRVGDGDTGPNTGGMGTYAPAPIVTPELGTRIREEIIDPTVAGMKSDGAPFRGTLFAGLMISPDGEPSLLEINVRFGDPETQVLMGIVEGDFAEALAAAASGKLAVDGLSVSDAHAVCVVLAASGYPASPRKGDAISGLDEAAAIEGVTVYHAGTKLHAGQLVTNGGRVLGVTARGATLADAHARAYRAVDAIHFDGKQLRRDIAARALNAK